MYGYIFRTSAKGTSRAQPRIRKAIRPLIPATTPIPSVWRNRTPGYARSEFDSRTHTEKPLCSIAARNCIIKNVLYSQSDATIPESNTWQNAKMKNLTGFGHYNGGPRSASATARSPKDDRGQFSNLRHRRRSQDAATRGQTRIVDCPG